MSYWDFLSSASSGSTVNDAQTEVVRQRRLLNPPPFYIAKLTPTCFVDPLTRQWIRNAADERAAQEGCFFSTERAEFTVDWIEQNCIVYEGDKAGEPFYLDDWAYEAVSQIFGWMTLDTDRNIYVRRFRRCSGWVPKKNGKSPTLAAIGTYMWAGDGEHGQKCYSVAKDGPMARIAHQHAVHFVNQNPALFRQCKIDNSTLELTYRPTNSTYRVLYSGTSATSSKQEGLNGSTFVDETHVVSGELIDTIDRAGISRVEPLHCEFSTTGNNTEGYGHEQYKYGQKNIIDAGQGKEYNSRFLFFNYGIPQDTSLAEIRDPANFDRYVEQSNPALGRLVMRSELREDWQKSRHSDTKLAKFAYYRFNQWQKSGTPAIAGTDWDRCTRQYRMEQLSEFPCVIGLDLSRNRDMTAVIFTFAVPGGEAKRLLTNRSSSVVFEDAEEDFALSTYSDDINVPFVISHFFLPEATIDLYAEHINLNEIGGERLRKCSGLTVNPVEVAAFIDAHYNKYDIRCVAADPWRFKFVAAALKARGWIDEQLVKVRQNAENMCPAYETLERLVLCQELIHDSDRVLNWQLSNIRLKEDENGNRRVIKPKVDNYQKIDGIAGLMNALVVMCADEELFPGSEPLLTMAE